MSTVRESWTLYIHNLFFNSSGTNKFESQDPLAAELWGWEPNELQSTWIRKTVRRVMSFQSLTPSTLYKNLCFEDFQETVERVHPSGRDCAEGMCVRACVCVCVCPFKNGLDLEDLGWTPRICCQWNDSCHTYMTFPKTVKFLRRRWEHWAADEWQSTRAGNTIRKKPAMTKYRAYKRADRCARTARLPLHLQ